MNRKKKIVQIQISQIPHQFSQGVLQNQYMLFDNLDEETTANLLKTADPIQTNDLLSIHVARGTLEMEVNYETVVLKERQIVSIMPGSTFNPYFKRVRTAVTPVRSPPLYNSPLTFPCLPCTSLRISQGLLQILQGFDKMEL